MYGQDLTKKPLLDDDPDTWMQKRQTAPKVKAPAVDDGDVDSFMSSRGGNSITAPAPRKGKSTFAPGPRYYHPPDGQHRGFTTNYDINEPVVRTPEEQARDTRIFNANLRPGEKPKALDGQFKSPISLDFRGPTEAQKLVDRALPAAQPKPQPKARPRNAFQASANRQSTLERIQNQQATEMRNPQPQTVETDLAKLEELGRATSAQQNLQRETRQQLDRANRIQSLRGTPSLDPVSRTGARIAGLLRGASPQEIDEAIPRMADVPVVGQAEDITNRFVSRSVRGAAGIPEGLARFADRQLNRGDLAIAQAMEQALAMHPEWSPEEKQATKAKINQIYANQSAIGDTFAGLTKAGEQASRIVTPTDPNKQGSINPLNPNFYSVTLPEAAGSMAPFMAGGAAGAAAKVPTALTSGILGVGMSVPDQYRKAKELGASPDQLARAVDTGTLAGLIESLGAKSLMGEVAETGRRFIPRVLGEGAKEAGQEALQSGVSDLGAKFNERTQPNLTAGQMLTNAAQQAIPAAFLGGAGGIGSSNVARRQAEMTRAEQPAPMNLRPTMTGPTQITKIPQATTATQPAIEPQSAIPAQTAKPRTAPAENVNPATPSPAVEIDDDPVAELRRIYAGLLPDDDVHPAPNTDQPVTGAPFSTAPLPATPLESTRADVETSVDQTAPTVTGALRAEADASKIEAAEFEQAGDFEQAAAAYDATHKNLKLLQQKIGRPKTPEDVARLGQIQRELSSAARNRQRATAQAKQMARQANKPTAGLPESKKLRQVENQNAKVPLSQPAESAPLLRPEAVQNPSGGIPQMPEQTFSGRLDAGIRKQEAAQQVKKGDTEALTIAGMLKRRFPEGIFIADTGEARNLGGREGNALVGLVNKNSRTGIDDAAYALHEEGLTLPDGRPFVEGGRVVATEADVLDFIRSNGKQKVGGTKSLAKGLEQEEADYYASQEGQLSPNFDEIVADVDSEFTPDTGDLRAVREFGQRNEGADDYTEEPQTAPLARRPARMKESPEVTAMREREKLPLTERREALRQAVPKGQFGKISEAAYKNRPNALVEHPQLRRLLGLKEMPVYRLPDAAINPKTGEPYVNPEWSAEAQNTLNMLANLAGKERSSQISFTEGERHGKTGQPTRSEMGEVYAAVSRLARRKGEAVDPGLRSAFEEAVTRARTHNQGWQEFSVDDRTENIRQSLYERIRNGNLTRKEESALRTSFKSVAADFGISESSAADLFNQTRDEARRRAERSGSKPSPSATTQPVMAERGQRISGDRPSGEAAKATARVELPQVQPKTQNFTQFASERGLASDFDVIDHGDLGPSGSVSNRARKAAQGRQADRAAQNQQAHKEFEEAIRKGEVIDANKKLTKESLETQDKKAFKKAVQSKIDSIDSQIRFIENLGTMSHLPNGKLKKGYQRTVDGYNQEKAELLKQLEAQPKTAKPADSLAQIENDLSWGAITEADARRRKAALKEQPKARERGDTAPSLPPRNYWKTSRVETAPVTKEEGQKVVADSRAEFRPSSRGGGTVWTNQQGAIVIASALKQTGSAIGDTGLFNGVSMSHESAREAANLLREHAEAYGEDGRQLTQIADVLDEAVADSIANWNQDVVVADSTSVDSLSEAKRLLREERFHSWQRRQGLFDPAVGRALDATLRRNPTYGQIRKVLLEEGYPDQPDKLIREGAAKAASGQWERYGLKSEQEALDFLNDYYKASARMVGVDVLAELAPATPQARRIQDANREENRRAGLSGGIRPTARTSERTGDAPSLGARNESGRSERSRKTDDRRVSPAKRSSFGPLANEPRGQIAASGLGGLQNLFGRGEKVKTPEAVPDDWDVDKFIAKIGKQILPQKAKDGSLKPPALKVTNEQAKEIMAATKRMLEGAKANDRVEIFHARADMRKALMPELKRDVKWFDHMQSRLSNVNFKGTYERIAGKQGKEISEIFRNAQVDVANGKLDRGKAVVKLHRELKPYVQRLKLAGKPGLARWIENHIDAVSDPDQSFKGLAGFLKGVQYNTKLRLNPRSALVNALQPFQTLWPHLTTREWLSLQREAARPATWKRIGELSAQESGGSVENTNDEKKRLAWLDLFTPVSEYNRIVGHLAGELFADRKGLTGDAKARMAADWAKKVEFDNSAYDIPPLFSGKIAGVVGQFKPFMVKNLERIYSDWKSAPPETLATGAGPDAGKIARRAKMVTAQILIGGVRSAVPGLKMIGGVVVLGALAKGLSSAGMGDDEAEKLAEAVYFGAPGLIEQDLSGSVMVFDDPFGKTAYEKMVNFGGGPTLSLIAKAYEEGKQIYNAEDSKKSTKAEKQQAAGLRLVKAITPLTKSAIAIKNAVEGERPELWLDKKTPMTLPEMIGYGLQGTPLRQTKHWDKKETPELVKSLMPDFFPKDEKAKTGTRITDDGKIETGIPKRKDGEPEAVYKQRVERVQAWMAEYGDKLIANPRYNLLTEAEKKAAIELLRDRIGRQQNLVKPRTSSLEPNAVLLGVKKSAANRPKRQAKNLWNAPK